MNVPELERAVASHFTEHHAAWQLDPHTLRVSYVYNAGGFVNHSFLVGDERTRLHVKTSPKSDDADLRRWMSLADPLSRRYHAPVARGWIELSEVQMAGIAFERIEGVVPRNWSEAPISEVCDVIGRLHADSEILARLGRDRPPSAVRLPAVVARSTIRRQLG